MIVAARISISSGWLQLNDGVYRLSADAFAETAETWRRTEVINPFLEGAWLVNALRENVTETLSVWVRGDSTTTTEIAVQELRAALRQINYILQVTFDEVTYTYNCYTADNSVKSSRELRHSQMAQVVAQIPRAPGYTVSPAYEIPDPEELLDGGTPTSTYSNISIDAGGV